MVPTQQKVSPTHSHTIHLDASRGRTKGNLQQDPLATRSPSCDFGIWASASLHRLACAFCLAVLMRRRLACTWTEKGPGWRGNVHPFTALCSRINWPLTTRSWTAYEAWPRDSPIKIVGRLCVWACILSRRTQTKVPTILGSVGRLSVSPSERQERQQDCDVRSIGPGVTARGVGGSRWRYLGWYPSFQSSLCRRHDPLPRIAPACLWALTLQLQDAVSPWLFRAIRELVSLRVNTVVDCRGTHTMSRRGRAG